MKFLEKFVKIVNELNAVQKKVDFLRGELDNTVCELTEYLKEKELLKVVDVDSHKFINYYECECGNRWEDVYFHIVDDECSDCGKSVSPYETKDYE